ncbi:SGNH hydrolase-type esterase domain containing protein [Naviculisporaceae sp. PSN 640]
MMPHHLVPTLTYTGPTGHLTPFAQPPIIEPVVNLSAPYVKPTGKVFEFVALGDSITAGCGANGIPERFGGTAERGRHAYPMQMREDVDMWEIINGERMKPNLTFLAYTEDRFRHVRDRQLQSDGPYMPDNWDQGRGAPFGNPQFAVMTIGGNDADFTGVINDCIYRMWFPSDCHEALERVRKDFDNGVLESAIRSTMLAVVHKGRKARGADPPESFQLYVPQYPSFVNAVNPQCDRINWHFFRKLGPKHSAPLTRELRRRLNVVVSEFNMATKRAADSLKDMGVIYVDGIDPFFDGHRYCEFGQTSHYMDHRDTWIWSEHVDPKSTSEGRLDGGDKSRWEPSRPDRRDTSGVQSRLGAEESSLLEFVFGEQASNQTLLNSGTPPWTWPGAEKYPTFSALMSALHSAMDAELKKDVDTMEKDVDKKENGIINKIKEWFDMVKKKVDRKLDPTRASEVLWKHFEERTFPFRMLRSFHPKGMGYEVYKERLFAAIIENRNIPCSKNNITVVTQRLTGDVEVPVCEPTVAT